MAEPQASVRNLYVGQILRDARPKRARPAVDQGIVNIYAATELAGGKLIPFDAGINPLASVKVDGDVRRPAI